MHSFFVPVSGSLCSCRLGVACEYEHYFLRPYFGGYGRFSHLFYVAADSNPEVLFSLLLQNGEACPVDASGCSFAQRGSRLENWKYF